MSESKRDKAIELVRDLLHKAHDKDNYDDREVEAVVDAIIEAARAPESQHSRDVTAAQRKVLNDPRI